MGFLYDVSHLYLVFFLSYLVHIYWFLSLFLSPRYHWSLLEGCILSTAPGMSVLSPKSAIVKQIVMLLHPIDDAVPIFYFQANPCEATACVDMCLSSQDGLILSSMVPMPIKTLAFGPLAYQRYIEHKTL